MIQHHLVYSLPHPGISHFFKDSWYVREGWYLETKIWLLDVLIAATRASLLPDFFQGQSWEVYEYK